jgi:hypothetical protein
MIAPSNFSDAGPHFSDDSGTFVSEHERSFRRPVAACGMQIAVAHTGCFNFDEHFSRVRRFEFSLLDYQRPSLFPQDCSVDLH